MVLVNWKYGDVLFFLRKLNKHQHLNAICYYETKRVYDNKYKGFDRKELLAII